MAVTNWKDYLNSHLQKTQGTQNTNTTQGSTGTQAVQQNVQQTNLNQQPNTEAQGLRGLSKNTQAQQKMYQQAYTPSDSVSQAQMKMQQVLAGKPNGYTSKYGAAMDSLLAEIQNPQQFKYSFNNDPLFQYYSDLYQQQGRQASMDTMGQAAALTGGYGNSYAQAAGQQAYQQYLLGLYDKMPEFRDAAFQQYQAEQADRYNRLGALQTADESDYGRYRDEFGDWERERDYYTQAEESAYNRDYDQWVRNRDYWTQQAQMENADYWTATEFNEKVRQFEATSELDWAKLVQNQEQFEADMTEQQRQYNQSVAMDYVKAILAMGGMPSNELLVAAGLSQADAQKMVVQQAAPVETGGGGGSNNKPKPGKEEEEKDEKVNIWAGLENAGTKTNTSDLSNKVKKLVNNVKSGLKYV